jgi:hypothetical protein
MKTTDLRFFPDAGAVIDYCITELLATLNDDLASSQDDDAESETCAELEAKIADIELVQPMIEALPAHAILADAVRDFLAADAKRASDPRFDLPWGTLRRAFANLATVKGE